MFDQFGKSFNAVNTVLMCKIGTKYQYASRALCTYARLSEMTRVCAYWSMCTIIIRTNMVMDEMGMSIKMKFACEL